jgi:hypothetical protein
MAVNLWTSCLFSTIVMHAHVLGDTPYQIMFAFVTAASMLCYATSTTVIDIVAKHAAMFFVLMDTHKLVSTGNEWMICFPVAVAILWSQNDHHPTPVLDAALHMLAVCGAHVYLHVLY